MNLHEWIPILSVVGPIVIAVGSAVAAIVGLIRLHFRQLRRVEARAKRAERERDDASEKKRDAERERDVARAERDRKEGERQDAEQQRIRAAASLTEAQITLTRVRNERDQLRQLNTQHTVSLRAEQEARLREVGEAHQQVEEANRRKQHAELAHQQAERNVDSARERESGIQKELAVAQDALRKAEQRECQQRQENERISTKLTEANYTINQQNEQLTRYETQISLVAKHDGRIWQAPLPANPPEFVSLAKRGTPIISLLNLKGGVGKTTVAANLAGTLANDHEKRVLLIDLDHQRSLSQLLLSRKERVLAAAAHTIQRFLCGNPKDGQALFDCSRPIPEMQSCRLITNADPKDIKDNYPNLDDLEMRLMTEWLVNPTGPDVRYYLRSALQSDKIHEEFDYVLIDCPPRLTTASINALVASDYLLIPAQTESVSLASVHHLLQRLQPLRACGLLHELRLLGVLANMVPSAGLNDASPERELLANAKKGAPAAWGAPVPFFKILLKRDDNYAKASRFLELGEPLRLAIHYKGVREDFASLANEIGSKIKDESRHVAGVFA